MCPTGLRCGSDVRAGGCEMGLEFGAYILFLGRFSPEKNCDLLVQAYEQMDTPVKLVLAGGSSYSDGYVTQLRGHRSDRIAFLDWVSGEALDELLTHAMLFVLPSDIKGLSLALLDAMGAGVCVLASDVPENREVVEDTGFTFRHGDRNDLERMLRLLISEPEIRIAASGRARERVWEHYLWGRVARDRKPISETCDRQFAQARPSGAGIWLSPAGRIGSHPRERWSTHCTPQRAHALCE